MVRSWYTVPPPSAMRPDVRVGGFGPLFRFCTLPCLLLVAMSSAFGRRVADGVSVLGLFLLALLVPDAWWPRFTLCAAAAALAALTLVQTAIVSGR